MPELPEVETVVRGLRDYLVGHRIVGFDFDWPKTIKTPIEIFEQEVVGAEVVGIRRRAKLIIIEIQPKGGINHLLLIHLKMTGQVVYRSKINQYGAGHPNDSLIGRLPDKSTRIHFKLDNSAELFFNDVRKFGWVEIIQTEDEGEHKFISALGPEPLEIKFADFKKAVLRYPGAQIKAKLLDQKVIAGIGNIYADEALWAAKIHPQTKIGNIPIYKLRVLFKELVAILSLSIEQGGSSSANYVKVDGKAGSYLTFAKVYKREGSLCERCGSEIIRMVSAGRGTRICRICQKLTS